MEMAKVILDTSSDDEIFSYCPVKRRKARELPVKSTSSGVIAPSTSRENVTEQERRDSGKGRKTHSAKHRHTRNKQNKSNNPKRISKVNGKADGKSLLSGHNNQADVGLGTAASELMGQVDVGIPACVDGAAEDKVSGGTVTKELSLDTQNKSDIDKVPLGVVNTPTNKRSKKSNTPKTTTPWKERKVHEGACPFCQMPFSALTIESPRWHAMECMDLPIIAIQECPAGLSCDNTIASHYRKFRHTLIAERRAGCTTEDNSTESGMLRDSAPEKKCPKQLKFELEPSPTCSVETQQSKPVEGPDPPSVVNEESGVEPFASDSSQGGGLTLTQAMIQKSKAALTWAIAAVTNKSRSDEKTKTTEEHIVHSIAQIDSPLNKQSHDKQGLAKTQPTETTPLKNPDTLSENVSPYFKSSVKAGECPQLIVPKSEPMDGYPSQTYEDTTEQVGKIIWDVKIPPTIAESTEVPIKKEFDFTERDLHDLLCDSDMEEELNIKKEPSDFALGTAVEIHNEPSEQKPDKTTSNLSSITGRTTTLPNSNEVCSTSMHQMDRSYKSPLKQNNSMQRPIMLEKSPLRKSPKLAHTETKQLSIASFFGGRRQQQSAISGPIASTSQGSTGSSFAQLKRPGTGTDGPVRSGHGGSGRGGAGRGGRGWGGPAPKTDSHSTSSSSTGGGEKNSQYGRRSCPFYKQMPGTPFTVDAFRYGNIPGCKAYFLTHFHYDHYGGLNKGFSNPLYCTTITANLVKKKIRVDDKFITSIPLDTPTMVLGVEVTFVEANHCPGAVLILFKLPDGRVILHTGDFRADVSMQMNPAFVGTHIHELYLDTTYCDPQYAFPPQQDVITYAVNIATDFVHMNPNTLIVVGSYTIGKERIFLAIAEALDCKICVTREKKNILDCLENPGIEKRLTLKAHEAKLHVLPMKDLRYPALVEYLKKLKPRFDKILGFEPTGWTHNGKKCPALEDIKPKIKSDSIVLYGVPYSEHSSYTEMKSFVQFTRPDKILPTVNNGNPTTRKKMEGLFASWLSEESTSGSPMKKMRQSAINTWFRK